jgi:hypothetical protein
LAACSAMVVEVAARTGLPFDHHGRQRHIYDQATLPRRHRPQSQQRGAPASTRSPKPCTKRSPNRDYSAFSPGRCVPNPQPRSRRLHPTPSTANLYLVYYKSLGHGLSQLCPGLRKRDSPHRSLTFSSCNDSPRAAGAIQAFVSPPGWRGAFPTFKGAPVRRLFPLTKRSHSTAFPTYKRSHTADPTCNAS